MNQLEFLNTEFLGNSVKSYLIFGSVIFLGLIFKSLISSYLRRLIYKIVGDKTNVDGKTEFDDLLKKPLNYFLLIIILYFAFDALSFPSSWGLARSDEFGVKMVIEKGVSFLFITIYNYSQLVIHIASITIIHNYLQLFSVFDIF